MDCPFRRPSRALLLVLVMLVVLLPHGAAAQPSIPESRLKAAFVSKFPQFVEWPSTTFEGRPTLTMCVADADRVRSELQALVAGESIDGRAIRVRAVTSTDDVRDCQLLFLPFSSSRTARALLRRTIRLPILTVGDDERFLDEGGIISLRMVDGRLRFDVNIDTAHSAGLRLSSQLLQLALSVRGRT